MLEIFKKANYLIKNNRVKIEEVSDRRIYATVRGKTQDYSVIVYEDNSFSCDCIFGTIKTKQRGQYCLCSHAIAVIHLLATEGILKKFQNIGWLNGYHKKQDGKNA